MLLVLVSLSSLTIQRMQRSECHIVVALWRLLLSKEVLLGTRLSVMLAAVAVERGVHIIDDTRFDETRQP